MASADLGAQQQQRKTRQRSNARGKENVCPIGDVGLIGSPLPEGYPRLPLQDITQILGSVSRHISDENNQGKRKHYRPRKAKENITLTVIEDSCMKQCQRKMPKSELVTESTSEQRTEEKSEPSIALQVMEEREEVEVYTTIAVSSADVERRNDEIESSQQRKRRKSSLRAASKKPSSSSSGGSILKFR